ncbi:hypothetical protein QR680_016020 [Steinernema hermaphroditum]|uniref:Uncharacterized protein n=1 Tax=Steinernema hermaphroditum TaxID=289476 RepID=A0AA39H9R6_9BILA|nr:hypothetical protein QR680_016018 [Steinernema hermaphroditum]KAK0401872.1 hypothetical protein QR680_016020 [Steinernema hermaphroditum]
MANNQHIPLMMSMHGDEFVELLKEQINRAAKPRADPLKRTEFDIFAEYTSKFMAETDPANRPYLQADLHNLMAQFLPLCHRR